MLNQELALRALREVDFDWTMHIKGVWHNLDQDVGNLHNEEREKILNELERLKQSNSPNSPLGMVIVGPPGAGKTHLLAAMRRNALSHGFGFVLVDMTDIHDFSDTLLRGYISSLQQLEPDGTLQFQKLIQCLISFTGSSVSFKRLAQASPSILEKATKAILAALLKKDRQAATKFQDVVRAVLLLNSNDIDAFNIGDCWLQGLEIEKEDKATFGFSRASMDSLSIVEGLSWLMSLRGPSILALDQLDSIVTQHHLASGTGVNPELSEEQRISKSIIEGLGGGLMALRDRTFQTLIVVSCLHVTWTILKKEVVQSFKDRFRDEMFLGPVLKKDIAEQIIASRLQKSYEKLGFSPEHPTWPFSPEFFDAAREQFPRKILQRCNKHREHCLANNRVTELLSFVNDQSIIDQFNPALEQLDKDFLRIRQQVKLDGLLDERAEDEKLGTLLQTGSYCLVKENPTAESIDARVEIEKTNGSAYPSLHSRICLVFHDEREGEEKHLCLRALQRSNAKAYQTRLKAAMTTSGIDRSLSFRQLMIVRTQDIPGGAATQKLTKQFQQAGGLFLRPTEDELLTLLALQELQKKKDPHFEAWLRDRRPVSQLLFMQYAVMWLFGDVVKEKKEEKPPVSSDDGTPDFSPPPEKSQSEQVTIKDPGLALSGRLPLGARLVGKQTKELISIPVDALTKHTIVLAGSGSGKTVLVRRLVEEAALLGIPAIVIDSANDLARMGDRWSTPPENWSDGDRQKAERYHQNTQVAVWTPGREAGNPLSLEPLPDLAAVKNDPEELDQAADMARDALQEIVAPGKAQTAILKRGILKAALMYFAKDGGGRLPDLIELLSDLPLEAGGGIADAGKKAQAMADSLRAEILNNPLLRQSGSALDPSVLFGLDNHSGKTRISILNFVGLPSLEAQQQFLNQLFMTLFTWIKKNPAPKDQPLRGLLVLDEAKDFVPSIRSTPCKASLNRLAAQARKYGLGLIFATQAPKSIDHNIIANCSTQFYGRANSPTAIEVIEEQLRQRGGSGQDIARLEQGQFYATSERLPIPTKILTPLCLSDHPSSPLGESDVLERARRSRNRL